MYDILLYDSNVSGGAISAIFFIFDIIKSGQLLWRIIIIILPTESLVIS